MLKKSLILFAFILLSFTTVYAQQQTIYLNRDYNRVIERALLLKQKTYHSNMRPFLYSNLDSLVAIDSAVNAYFNTDTARKNNWFLRKLTQEHLGNVNQSNIRIYADLLLELNVGKELNRGNIFTNTRGAQLAGDIGNKFSFYTAITENLSQFPEYLNNYIKEHKVVPGQSVARISPKGTVDYGVPYGYISYSPNANFNFQLGQGKNFIGDGYRSLFLSDGSYTYPYFKISTTFWKIKYTNLWTQYVDASGEFKFTNTRSFPKKYASYQFLSYQVNRRLNLNFFQALVWPQDSTGNPIEWAYINPMIYFNALNFNMGSPANSLMGLGFSYQLMKSHKLYGQLLLDDFNLGNLSKQGGTFFQEKYAYQLGWKYFDALNVPNLYFQAEFNRSRPYVYTHRTLKINYTHFNEPLAHPLGANFNELILIGAYKFRKLELNGKINFATYGADTTGTHFGKNIFLSDYDSQYGQNSFGNYTGQGIKTKLTNVQADLSYLVNPKTNLKLCLGLSKRVESSSVISTNSIMVYIGIKTALNNFYYDF
ncbi:hypothetical protein NF867_04420 [Solitalea sp. MAHUQ-68]|uniref:Gliding motility protein RemB n=1 Tax=Solitalea agri TaxID=2953739 RepID=A0A9X2JCT1_9SPHI|nr:hypothetical protein [Solitalea agri]MCO4292105.1 hypothetical protein [Solitalea agri]